MDELMGVAVIVAEVEEPVEAPVEAGDPQMEELDRRIRELEAAMGDLRLAASTSAAAAAPAAVAASVAGPLAAAGFGRKTSVSPAMASLGDAGSRGVALDAALGSLSVEQRIAVKSGMLRAGLL